MSRTIELTDELDTVGVCDFEATLTGGYTAHPKRDPDTGELHAVSYSMHRGNTVQYSVIGVDGRARRTVDIEVGGSPMMHDFSLTEHHVVFYDLPVTFDSAQGRGDDCAARAATARPAIVVGLDRPGPHPGSDHRAPAAVRRLQTADSRTRGTLSTPPASG